ncbi:MULTISPECIES: pyridoxal phosphate-dependent aminotransferase [unclassified Achromobacter]|uniref:pyridoxal phosphate-dependent aminotransferase n=1 Tax=unclassified Achromobacter TaxID=2626865 RepID=UPI0013033845|nr:MULTISPECIES: pyridoxal phosphate-dependent aminotransferase [unclassified Achromobacter]
MPKLAHRATEVRPSPTMTISARAAEMKRQGKDVIPFSLGEPDFHTPRNIKEAGMKAITSDFTKYTAADGYGPLKKAIADKMLRDSGIAYLPAQIVIGSGAKVILLASLYTIVDAGNEVIIPAPYWVTYPDHVEMVGGVPVIVECPEASGFKLTPKLLRASLTEKTRAIIFNSPNNPSGAVYSADEIRALAEVLKQRPDVWILTDELYEHITFDGVKAPSFVEVMPDMADRVIAVNGFSKGYVMTGWRLGFAAGPLDVIKSIGDLLSSMTGSPSSIAQAAGIEALAGDQAFMDENRRIFQERRDVVIARIAEIPGISAVRPSGTFYVYINCGEWLGRETAAGRILKKDVDVVAALLEEAEVAAVPGEVFGLSPFFRVSIALELDQIQKGLDRIHKFALELR